MRSPFKKTKYVQLTPMKRLNNQGNVPAGSWVKCTQCGTVIHRSELDKNEAICSSCSKHFRLDGPTRIASVIDEGTFNELFNDLATANPLNFNGYDAKIESLKNKTRLHEAIVTGTGDIEGKKVAIAVMDARFMMGSMGSVVGEKLTLLAELATEERLPLIVFTASGGARMQEGIISLMQMAKTSAAIKKHSDAGLLYITVLTDPTTGGVTASFAMLGDIILAEPGSLIGFAGPRVIRDTIKQDLPDGFQRAEFLLEHGFVDKIVTRDEMKSTLSLILSYHVEEAVK